MKKKILVSEIKDNDGVKIVSAMTHPVHWRDLEDSVRNDTCEGRKVVVRFYERTQEWVDKQPEYEG